MSAGRFSAMRSFLVCLCLLLPSGVVGQGTQVTAADYERAATVSSRLGELIIHEPSDPTWIGRSNRFWYSRSVADGDEFMLVDAATAEKRTFFDHARMALLSHDGSEGDFYTLQSLRWSPDSRKLMAYRRTPGYGRTVYFIRSSPDDQVQPAHELPPDRGRPTNRRDPRADR